MQKFTIKDVNRATFSFYCIFTNKLWIPLWFVYGRVKYLNFKNFVWWDRQIEREHCFCMSCEILHVMREWSAVRKCFKQALSRGGSKLWKFNEFTISWERELKCHYIFPQYSLSIWYIKVSYDRSSCNIAVGVQVILSYGKSCRYVIYCKLAND